MLKEKKIYMFFSRVGGGENEGKKEKTLVAIFLIKLYIKSVKIFHADWEMEWETFQDYIEHLLLFQAMFENGIESTNMLTNAIT